jgi:hypothetical protein
MPEAIGYVGDESHDLEIRRLVETEQFYREQLAPWFDQIVPYWKLYLADREDTRREDEKWRANVFVPYPYSGLEAKVTSIMDLINSADRFVQVEGVDAMDDKMAPGVEYLLDYTLRINRFRTMFAGIMRSAGIQGAEGYQVTWRKRGIPMKQTWDVSDVAELQQAITVAVNNGAPPPPSPTQAPAQFKVWADMVVKAGKVDRVPSLPGDKIITTFRGPSITRVSLTDLRFDPIIEEWEDQPCIMKRSVVSEEWLYAQVRAGRFDEAQVAKALGGYGGAPDEHWQKWQEEVAQILKINPSSMTNPLVRKPHEIFEVYQPNHQFKYVVMLNRLAAINHDPTKMPYDHQSCPIHLFRNHPIPGFAIGMSHFRQTKSLYHEMNVMRSMRLDSVLISLLPILLRRKDAGMPEMRRLFRPGSMIDVPDANAVSQLVAKTTPPEAFREVFEIKQDIDEAEATSSQLRGASATVGRVSASESVGRLDRAMVRMKDALVRAEDEATPMVKQSLFLWYQFGEHEEIVNASGGREAIPVSKREMFDSLDKDYRFRGASRAMNRGLQAQQSMDFGMKFGVNLAPTEMRSLMKRVYELLDLKGVDDVIQDKYTTVAQTGWDQKMLAAGVPVPGSEASLPPDQDPAAAVPPGQPVDVGEELADQIKFNEGGGLGPQGNVQGAPGQPGMPPPPTPVIQ